MPALPNHVDRPDPQMPIKTLTLRQVIFLELSLAGLPTTDKFIRTRLRSLKAAHYALQVLDETEKDHPLFHDMPHDP